MEYCRLHLNTILSNFIIFCIAPNCGFDCKEIIDKSDGVGNTPLHAAVQYGHSKVESIVIAFKFLNHLYTTSE